MLSACAPVSFEAFDTKASLLSPDVPVMSELPNGLHKSEDETSDSEVHPVKVSRKITGFVKSENVTPTKRDSGSESSEVASIKEILNGSVLEINGELVKSERLISSKNEKGEKSEQYADLEKKIAPKRRREKHTAASICCQFVDASGAGQVCKQRAILSFQYCIRHILLDPSAPYKQCQHQRKPKSKKDTNLRCTNAVRDNLESPTPYCSTHMIMNGMKEAKKRTINTATAPQTPAALHGQTPSEGIEGASASTSALPNLHPDGFAVKSPIVVVTDMQVVSPSVSCGSQLVSPNMAGPIPSVHTLVGHQNLSLQVGQQQPLLQQFQNSNSSQGPSSVPTPSMPMPSPMGNHTVSLPNTAPPSPAPHMATHIQMQLQQPSTSTAMLPPQQLQIQQHSLSQLQVQHQQQITQQHPTSQQHQQVQLQRPNSRQPIQISQDAKSLLQQPVQSSLQQQQISSAQQQQQQLQVVQQQIPQQMLSQQVVQQQQAPPPRFPVQTIPHPQMQQNIQQTAQVVTGPAPQQQTQIQLAAPARGRQQQSHIQASSQVQQQPGQSQMSVQSTSNSQANSQGHTLQAGPSALITRQHPQLAARLLENAPQQTHRIVHHRKILNHPHFDPHRNAPLQWTAPPMRPPSPPEEDIGPIQGKKVIRLRQKRQRLRMVGDYRRIGVVDQMCKAMEDSDFDRTDLFPLGLEPSDDEESDLGPSGCDTSLISALPLEKGADAATQLYLVKKQLRLERFDLLHQAQMNAPLMNLAKRFPTAVGAAIRHRQMRNPPVDSSPMPTRRCSHVDNCSGRCTKPCLPMSNHCSGHVLYNVNQRLFSYCLESCCGRPVMVVDEILWDGRCAKHRPGQQPVPQENPQRRRSASSSNRPSTSNNSSAGRPVEKRRAVEESHSWDDVEQFLLSEGYPVDSPGSQQTAHSTPPASVASQHP